MVAQKHGSLFLENPERGLCGPEVRSIGWRSTCHLQQPSAVSCSCSPRCGHGGGDGEKDMEDPVGKAFPGQPGRDTPLFGPMTGVHSQELLPVLCSREESCWNPCAAAFSCQGGMERQASCVCFNFNSGF